MKKEFLDLGRQPIANGFLYEKDIPNEYFYNLKIGFDSVTNLVTHMTYVKPELMFNDTYSYRGSMSNTMVEHFKSFSEYLQLYMPQFPYYKRGEFKLLEIGSNDGVFLKNWKTSQAYAVEPCGNFAKETNDMGYKTYDEFWTLELAKEIKNEVGDMDVIYAANCMCHIPNLDETFKAVETLLSANGVFIFEDPSLANMINLNSYDQIYDEHPHIFSVIALKNLLERNGLTIVRVDNLTVHGGSNRIWAQRTDDVKKVSDSVERQLSFERVLGLDFLDTFNNFASRVEDSRIDLYNLLSRCRQNNKKVISYGATSKSTTIFNYCEIDKSLISYVIDTTPEKQGKLTPGSHIPIINTNGIQNDVDYVFLGAWNFADEIMKKEKQFLDRGGKFITHVPIVKFI